jgi:L-lactate dehydrogenase complex protein LldE
MKISLFIPCTMEQFYPGAALATLNLLEKLGCEVDYPMNQTCCGQPMLNAGCRSDAKATAQHFINTFKHADYIVCPSGSCVSMVRNHFDGLVEDNQEINSLRQKTYELCEFLVDILKVKQLDSEFHCQAGLHQSCHGLRELKLASGSERVQTKFSKPEYLLSLVKGLQLVTLKRPDECCGFGGTFAVDEKEVSCLMGEDRLADHEQAGATCIIGYDTSCQMHLEGIATRQKKNLRFLHIAQVLAGEMQ